jgi:RNA polymerase sigma factor FliA
MTVTVDREQLINDCQGLVKSLALKVHKQVGGNPDLDDLISDGQIGLAQAAKDFDPARGVKFSTFAYYRIRGAIYDGLSKNLWVKRRPPADVQYEQLADDVLQTEMHRMVNGPNDDGTEGATQWFQAITARLAVVYMMSQAGDAEQNTPDVVDDTTPRPDVAADNEEISARLRLFVDQLPADLGGLVRGVYFEGMTLQDAGERMGISKSWASRLHARALDTLAGSLRAIGVDG